MGKSEGRTRAVRMFVRALPALLIVVGYVFDVVTPDVFTGAPFFSAAPLIAAPLFSLRSTVLAGIAGTAAITLLHVGQRDVGGLQALTETLTVATVAALAVPINRVVRVSGQKLASAREVSEAAQRAVLPVPAERIRGLRIAARYDAARADAFIGGDLYAVQDTPYGVRLIVGDVRGKGMGAVEAVAVVIGAFREAAEQEGSLEAVALRLERALAREGTRRDGLDAVEGFTTAVLAEIPHGATVVRTVNRGHPEPLMLHPDGRVDVLLPDQFALPLGMGDLASWPDRVREHAFPEGATLLFYTDGLSEARDEHGVFYDPADRLSDRLSGRLLTDPFRLLDAVSEDVMRHTGGQPTDDMALLALNRPARAA